MQPLRYLVLPLLTLLFLTACSEIDEDERLIYVKPTPVGRNVLIEDFTGQRCVNCPTATSEIEKLQEYYGEDHVIAVGIHSGPFAKSVRGVPYPLYTEIGDEYYNYWKVESQPMGVINRTGTCDYLSWGAKVRDDLSKNAQVSLEASCDYDKASRNATITVKGNGVEGSVSGSLQVWLTEDNITDFQLMPDGSRNDAYVHNHVLRCAVNGTWGVSFHVGEAEQFIYDFTQILDDGWVPENMHVVAFVYDDTGVYQVTTCPVVPRLEW
jgi:hypothetical protein